jgi:RNA polymerase sigma-70 factor (ECF subfamily)
MPLTVIDEHLLERCLERKPRAWEDFVDRFLGLVIHVVNHAARAQSIWLSREDRDDLCADVMLALVQDDFAILRRFRGQSSLATYLTVVARRIVVRQLLKRRPTAARREALAQRAETARASSRERPDRRAEEREEARWFLGQLKEYESRIVQMHHLEERSYQEIGRSLGIPENSVGPMLSRARDKMRRAAVHQHAG